MKGMRHCQFVLVMNTLYWNKNRRVEWSAVRIRVGLLMLSCKLYVYSITKNRVEFILSFHNTTHPSVLQELDFIIYTIRGGGSWYFKPSSRVGLAIFTPIAGMGHLISEPKFKIPTPPTPPPPSPRPFFWQVPKIKPNFSCSDSHKNCQKPS